MSISHSITINRSAASIFSIYKDVDCWVQWDPDLDAVSLDGEFAKGTTGWLKPKGAPKTKTTLVSVSEPSSFVVESRLPLCTMRFSHQLEQIGTSADRVTNVTHMVEFEGLLAPLFSRLIGKKIEATIVGAMQGLKEFAEARDHATG